MLDHGASRMRVLFERPGSPHRALGVDARIAM
jgi:hypothetical protein